jgi:Tol biopolymer transport system component
LRLTDHAGDFHSTWSPDGRQIAFLRHFDDRRLGIFVMPSLGGIEHKLYTTSGTGWERGYVSWSPDGKFLAFTETSEDLSPSWIALLSLSDLTTRNLTSPPDRQWDCDPAISPDGSTILFARVSGVVGRDLFVLPAKGGEPRQLTFDNHFIEGYTERRWD